ncbi:MAG: iron transporter [Bdellovibrionales bacterium GWB1_52_6]|nr:MAG: iron transporter [Bdellovibrionales bacterium GWB1_52_6]OFZ04112.1 MAG: iron transporter [Bdellovibrionales bacterium GWA1_52_35]HCM39801.1 NifU family protein [Bdellovibrionales bacterium]
MVAGSSNDTYVSLEFTPNPNTLKYMVNRELVRRNANFTTAVEAQAKSPLAAKLFAVPGIVGVMIGRNFVTVSKSEDGDWDTVHQNTSKTIEQHLAANLPVLNEGVDQERDASADSEIERKIRQILDDEIRPAVAMDGGDIVFDSYEDGIVYLHLQGACAGCPGAQMTLKMGVENRLREAIPEVIEVVSV